MSKLSDKLLISPFNSSSKLFIVLFRLFTFVDNAEFNVAICDSNCALFRVLWIGARRGGQW